MVPDLQMSIKHNTRNGTQIVRSPGVTDRFTRCRETDTTKLRSCAFYLFAFLIEHMPDPKNGPVRENINKKFIFDYNRHFLF